jgi:predicted glycogen debranching enzyme
MIEFSRDICASFEEASSREWLLTNGKGGFACSTLAGLNTRRYHSLLTAATQPPVGRMVLLSKMEETLMVDGKAVELSANQYPGVIHPQGYRYLKLFRLEPFPTFVFDVDGVELEKTIFMVQGESTTVVEYQVRNAAGRSVSLELRPLVAFRDFHSTTHENPAFNSEVQQKPGVASLQPYDGVPRLYLAHNAGEVRTTGEWYRNFEYRVERERGLDYSEDLFNPLVLRFELSSSQSPSSSNPAATVVASTILRAAADAGQLRRDEIARKNAIAASVPGGNEFIRQLVLAADQYIVDRGEGKTVIAGYPWFSDWGRDTMISLTGLALVTGRFEVARQILLEFAASVDEGMLPNRFPDGGEAPEYNTVDATLWYFEAVRAYLAYTCDYETVRGKLYPVLASIISWHLRGTRHGIHSDPTGLLAAGEAGVQLTWMDAKIGDWVVTPRRGKPVEIQALWYNALRIMEGLAQAFENEAERKRYSGLAEVVKWSFNRLFWNPAAGCLYDVVNGGPPDASIRPNQIFAVSLHYTMLPPEWARSVVDVVEKELRTPYGLRSLAASDPRYVAHYGGDVRNRDSAYHQGTVWPWLLGPFLTAYLKVQGGGPEARKQAGEWMQAVERHLSEAGLGQISELFDAEPPYRPGGCFAQAWNIAELLRAGVEDVFAVQPAVHPETRKAVSPQSALSAAAV